MNRLIFSIFFLIFFSLSYGQNHTLSGYLRDAESGEELLYATVSVVGQSAGVETNV